MLNYTFYETLKRIKPRLAPELFSASALDHLERLTKNLPALVRTVWFLECRLREGSERVDIIIAVPQTAMSLFHDLWHSDGLPTDLLNYILGWQKIGKLNLVLPGSPNDLASKINYNYFWLEFDVTKDSSNFLPGTFIPISGSAFKVWRQANLLDQYVDGLMDIFRAFLGDFLPPNLEQTLLKMVVNLPPDASQFDLGIMAQRGQQEGHIRVCYEFPYRKKLLRDYLRAVDWPGDLDELERKFLIFFRENRYEYPEIGERGVLHFDIWEDLLPRISYEFHFDRPNLMKGGPRQMTWLNGLSKKNLCFRKKADALTSLSECYLDASERFGEVDLVGKMLNHVKICYRPDKPLEAKGYLRLARLRYRAQDNRRDRTGAMKLRCEKII